MPYCRITLKLHVFLHDSTSKALVTSSDALVSNSFLLLHVLQPRMSLQKKTLRRGPVRSSVLDQGLGAVPGGGSHQGHSRR